MLYQNSRWTVWACFEQALLAQCRAVCYAGSSAQRYWAGMTGRLGRLRRRNRADMCLEGRLCMM